MLKRFLEWIKRKPKVIYYPEVSFIPHVKKSEVEALMLDLVDGYQKHEAVFRVIMLYLRRKEAELCTIPKFESEADHFKWVEAQKVSAAEAGVLRHLSRLPLLGASIKRSKERGESGQDYTLEDI